MNLSSTDATITVGQSPEIGRFLLAARDIKEGEVVCSEEPLIIGPKQATAPVCLTCYRRVDGSYLCSACGWPLCDRDCEDSKDHRPECNLFASRQLKVDVDMSQGEDCRVYDCITPLRCLLMVDGQEIVQQMESHNSHRKRIGMWLVDGISVVDVIRYKWKMADLFPPEEIQTVCGRLEVNAFEVDVDGAEARAVYGTACLMAHDCVPNTFCSIDSQHRMTVTAAVPIASGQMITTSYTYSLDSTQRRRKHLKDTKFFDCLCQRCRDPTELGTHLSSLVCQSCPNAAVVAEDPLADSSFWKCTNNCGFRLDPECLEVILDGLNAQADALIYDDFAGLEEFIDRWSRLLHPNHSTLIGIKYYLIQFYGSAPGFLLEQLAAPLLRRKIQLCRDLLEIAHILEPGSSKLREHIVNELKSAEKEAARRPEFKKKPLKKRRQPKVKLPPPPSTETESISSNSS